MTETKGSSKEAQNKVVHFLKEEFVRLKFTHQEDLKKKTIKRKSIDRKRQKLYQKIEAMISIHSFDAEIKEALFSLQREIKNFS